MTLTRRVTDSISHHGKTLEGRSPLRVGSELLGQHLDRYPAAQAGVLALIHVAHAARAQQLEDLVGAALSELVSAEGRTGWVR